MSEYTELRTEMATIGAAMERYASAVNSHANAVDAEIKSLWNAVAELRDDLHALANRVETLTRARLTEPAEVAERMIPSTTDRTEPPFVCRLNPGCNLSRPHIHHDDGAVIYVPDEATADDQLRQREDAANVRRMAKEYE